MTKKIDNVLAEEGASAEGAEVPEVIPGGVEVIRPNIVRATVVFVRLSRDEHEQLQQLRRGRAPTDFHPYPHFGTRSTSRRCAARRCVSGERFARLERSVLEHSA